jgi:glucose/mannose-6-phosphate isomerase
MLALVEGFRAQVRHAVELGEKIELKAPQSEIRNVVVAGLGGSGIGANLVQSIVMPELKVPFSVYKCYDVPAFVNQHTLFIASSFSGNTEETLTAIEKAMAAGAQIVCITSGGTLMDIAREKGYSYAPIPGESKSPRACLGYSFVQLLYVLHKLGLISDRFKSEINAGSELLDKEFDAIQQEARSLAESMEGRLPILYADSAFEPLAVRAQQQINENSKQLCHVNIFPEMNHNELVGWVFPVNTYKNSVVLLLESSLNHERVKARMRLCKPIFEEKAGEVISVEVKGKSFLEQSLYLITLFDWVSIYLAERNNIDPKPVKIIDYLKSELAKA